MFTLLRPSGWFLKPVAPELLSTMTCFNYLAFLSVKTNVFTKRMVWLQSKIAPYPFQEPTFEGSAPASIKCSQWHFWSHQERQDASEEGGDCRSSYSRVNRRMIMPQAAGWQVGWEGTAYYWHFIRLMRAWHKATSEEETKAPTPHAGASF